MTVPTSTDGRPLAAARGRMIVLCGLPGSGKSTWAHQVSRSTGALVVSADAAMIERGIDLYDAAAREAIEDESTRAAFRWLEEGSAVIVDFGSWARWERDLLRRGARDRGAHVHLVTFDADDDTLFERIERRGMEARHGQRPFTRSDVASARARFEPPTPEELATFDPLPDQFRDSRMRAAAADAAP